MIAPTPATSPVSPAPAPVTNSSTPAPAPVAPQTKIETLSKTVSYLSPAGQENITFSIKTKDGIITNLSVTPQASHPVSSGYQTSFASNAPALIVGKSLI